MLVSQRTAFQAGNPEAPVKGVHPSARRDARIQRAVRCRASAGGPDAPQQQQEQLVFEPSSSRRAILLSVPPLVGSALLQQNDEARAIQGGTAGRIPGQSKEPDENGFYTYTRPEGKSGGHGVGWSEIPRYSFKVPAGWEETPVSIADLGGTEVDLRYNSKDEGSLQIVVAPILRFIDVGYNANVKISEIGSPEKIIKGFAPELYKEPLEDDAVMEQWTEQHDGLDYYYWRLKPYKLVAATAVKNRVFIISIISNNIKWRKHEQDLRAIQKSFRVPPMEKAFAQGAAASAGNA
ncbi:hypothetical protein DUNSADRAFT_7138 [Dunaliella salina]|uniref:PsbP C-terminal domain-containing protein n=1 Tax=Dunaliella salina TaxID=3046 RepID=A0ABQ7GM55_DUNSA|nr:hypothetical protein DUNSADRAFT_7138 [Dunaliella salina]|eukprot:KAF5835636.1 hypothetical protein DUNSADRAFT_7138 [Dunaliella salina]